MVEGLLGRTRGGAGWAFVNGEMSGADKSDFEEFYLQELGTMC